MAYSPEPIGGVASSEQLIEYLLRELERIGAELQLIEDGLVLPMRYTEPSKPREGMLVVADGTTWNPGSGQGLYEYKGGVWTKL